MKPIIIFSRIALLLLIILTACNEDFLNRYPENKISEGNFFKNPEDFRLYMNARYSNLLSRGEGVGGGYTSMYKFDNGSDNYTGHRYPYGNNPHPGLMQHENTGIASTSSGTWTDAYKEIRNINFLLGNIDKAPERTARINHYIGEAFFARAFNYFNLLKAFGGVPYFNQVLGITSEELYNARESRDFIAAKIIEDLDSAIALLDWKGKGEAKAARINKESALLFKTRVGLYEGSWEFYHGQKNTPFALEGKDGTAFLNEAIEAGEDLMEYQGDQIYTGPAGKEYSALFNQNNYQNITGAFFYRHYDFDLGKSFQGGQSDQVNGGMTHGAVKSYLMEDGKPEAISSVSYDYTSQNSLIHSRDPRLNQTIYAPDRGPFNETWDFEIGNIRGLIYGRVENTYTGYKVYKGLPLENVPNIGALVFNMDDLLFRYGEALLNYAEAKAILGEITQTDLDKTVNVLRNRVGMAPVNLGEVNSWNVSYSESEGFEPVASNIVNEIRRERRVELMFEGTRKDDLKRWAVFEEVVNGWKPLGAYYQEHADYFNNTDNLAEAGIIEREWPDYAVEIGEDIGILGEYINPWWRFADFTPSGRGYYIDPDRDYLQSVPKEEIELYREKGGVTLEQNPGWF